MAAAIEVRRNGPPLTLEQARKMTPAQLADALLAPGHRPIVEASVGPEGMSPPYRSWHAGSERDQALYRSGTHSGIRVLPKNEGNRLPAASFAQWPTVAASACRNGIFDRVVPMGGAHERRGEMRGRAVRFFRVGSRPGRSQLRGNPPAGQFTPERDPSNNGYHRRSRSTVDARLCKQTPVGSTGNAQGGDHPYRGCTDRAEDVSDIQHHDDRPLLEGLEQRCSQRDRFAGP